MRQAASLVLVRDGRDGLEVLLVQRGEAGDFPGLHVFPGGLVDAADADPRVLAASSRSEDSARALLGTADALPWFIAAVRESLEEVGVLLAGGGHDADARARWQDDLLARRRRLPDLLDEQPLRLDTADIGYFSHWITPVPVPRRYDTRFLVARMPDGQAIRVDGREAVRADWLSPAAALDAHERNDIRLIFPTIRNLSALAAFDSSDALMAHTQSARTVTAMLPKIVNAPGGMQLLLPGDPGYDAA